MGGRVSGRDYRDSYRLPREWEEAIAGWSTWLLLSGNRPQTLVLRTTHLRTVVRRSETERPREFTLEVLVHVCSVSNWGNEHRKGVRTSLNSFCDWAVRNGVMETNIAALLPKVRGESPGPRPATDKIWREMLAVATPRERLMIRLAGEAGLRRGEVAVCHRDDLIEDPNGDSLIVHGKGGKQRVVPLSPSLADALREHCAEGYMFPSLDRWGHELAPHMSTNAVGKLIGDLMPEGWSMHKLRHRFATRAYRGSRNLRAVQVLLGHASVATTERYVAVDDDEVRAAMMSALGNSPPGTSSKR